jgi:hypothetical protein
MDLTSILHSRGSLDGTILAAHAMVSMLHGLFKPRNVLDLGCGDGAFSREFIKHGCPVAAFDRTQPALIARESWDYINLLAPYNFTSHYDLALCLEVAEHLPTGHVTDELIRNLCQSADVVVFSAAIPLQGGSGHVSEHWQSFWAEKFSRYSYLPCSVVRDYLWNLSHIPPWYAQNTLVYARQATLDFYNLNATTHLDAIHPNLWLHVGPMGFFKRLCSLLQLSSPLLLPSSFSL